MVKLKPPGRRKTVISRKTITDYMKNNVDSWLSLANETWGADKKEDDLMFVSGVLTTSEWVAVAFQGPVTKSKGASVNGDIAMVASGEVTVNLSGKTLPTEYYRYGPRDSSGRMIINRDQHAAYPTNSNHCLFFHYYKMKRKWVLFKEPMKASAGDHQLPPPENSGSEGPVIGRSHPTILNEPEEVSVPVDALVSIPMRHFSLSSC